jgi:dTDP-4-amino-4,6-dideoxygalactose transaminase
MDMNMLNTSFSPWPAFSEEEVSAVARVVASGQVNYWTGQEAREFEREFADWTQTSHAVALGNGTLALDLALKGLGIGPGDEVVVTPRTFIASISCVVTAGATPVFADIDRDSGNITPATIARVLTPRTRAVIPVHLAGWPCDMDGIMALADDKIKVIEDCAQAHGAQVGGRSVGAIGHVGAWSFCQDKIMSTGGEGGMVTTSDPELWDRMWSYKDHGKSFDAVYNKTHGPGFRWLHEHFGTNWRMLEVQAAIGRIQLRRMAAWARRRTEIAQRFAEALDALPNIVRTPRPDGNVFKHAYYRLYAYVRPEMLSADWSRDRIIAELNAAGMPAFQGSCSEVYLEKAFDGTGWRPRHRLPVARELGETSIMFLTHPTITDKEVERGCVAIASVLANATD